MDEGNNDHVNRLASQGASNSPLDVTRVPFDASLLCYPTGRSSPPPPHVAAQNRENVDDDEDESEDGLPPLRTSETATATQPRPSTTRQRARRKAQVKYANRKLLGNYKLFLNPSSNIEFRDEDALILGQIKKCPNKNNNYFFTVLWEQPPGVPYPIDRNELSQFI